MESFWLKTFTTGRRLWNFELSVDKRIKDLGYVTRGIYRPRKGDTVKIVCSKDNGYSIEFYVKESEIDENLIDRIYYSLLFN
jgi:hypothetical protein